MLALKTLCWFWIFCNGFLWGFFVCLFCLSFQLDKSSCKVNQVLIFRGLEFGKEHTFLLSSGSGIHLLPFGCQAVSRQLQHHLYLSSFLFIHYTKLFFPGFNCTSKDELNGSVLENADSNAGESCKWRSKISVLPTAVLDNMGKASETLSKSTLAVLLLFASSSWT